MNTDIESLLSIHEVGDIMANSISDYFSNQDNRNIIQKCIQSGIEFTNKEILKDSKISGKVFVITGSLNRMTRSMAKESIDQHNARLSSTVSNNTDFLILGDSPGNKFEKAKKLAVKIINEKEFLTMLENS